MTFKPSLTECFVYITLPGQTEPVTAGKFTIRIDRDGNPRGLFRYGKSYLARNDHVPIDPVELKIADRTYATQAMKGVFGALRDASPDYWGRRVIERHAGKPELGEIDYLLCSPDDRAGALGFGLNVESPSPKRKFNQTVDLTKLQEIVDAIVNDEAIPADASIEQVDELILAGTSMGGARPKAVVEDEDGLWLAKFNRPDDRWNCVRVEHAMLELARQCTISAAQSRIIEVAGRDVLLVKRFDRERVAGAYTRARMISGLTLLRTEDTHRSRDRWSYLFLVEELRRVSATPKQDAQELFRRMCFNAMISNTDDHPRNHAFIAWNKDWRLSPAYDLTPNTLVSSERRDLAMICGINGRFANATNLVSQAGRFLLKEEQASAILQEMEEIIQENWYSVSRRAGVSEQDCERIKGAFLYKGFNDMSNINV